MYKHILLPTDGSAFIARARLGADRRCASAPRWGRSHVRKEPPPSSLET